MLLTTQAILNAMQVQYVQLAAIVSIVSFLVGMTLNYFTGSSTNSPDYQNSGEQREVLIGTVERPRK
jgi:hypothetical protein